jgi:tetratricopeptide (TPR) repeat protein
MLAGVLRTSIIIGITLCAMLAAARAESVEHDFESAKKAISDLDWRTAAELYAGLRESSKIGTAEWSHATFGLATATLQNQPLDARDVRHADALYAELVKSSSDENYIARALLARGRICELQDYLNDTIDLPGARAFYKQVMQRFADNPLASEAALRAGATYVMAYDGPVFADVKNGLRLLENWQQQYPNNPLSAAIWQYMGDSYFTSLNDAENALRCYEQVDMTGWPDQGNQGPIYWRCAVMAEKYLNKPETAVKYYTKIIIETPNSGKAYEALLSLKRLNAPLPYAPMLHDAPPATQEARP